MKNPTRSTSEKWAYKGKITGWRGGGVHSTQKPVCKNNVNVIVTKSKPRIHPLDFIQKLFLFGSAVA